MKTLTDRQKELLFDTRKLSVAESAGICKQTQDTVRMWRRKHGHGPKRDDHVRYRMQVGEHCLHAYQTGKRGVDVVGEILAVEGRKYLVRWEDGERWQAESELAAYPTEEEIVEKAYAIKMANIERMIAAG